MFQKIKIPSGGVYVRSNYKESNGTYESDNTHVNYQDAIVILTSVRVTIIYEKPAADQLIKSINDLLSEKPKPEVITQDISCEKGMLMNAQDLVRIIGAVNSTNKASDLIGDK